MTDALKCRETQTAYEALAPIYDAFTAGHDYALWTAVIRRLAREHGLAGTRLLDIGCGTGKSFMPFVEDGWQVTACDLSSHMLELAAAKAPPEVELHVADARDLPHFGSFDLVLLLDDVVNHFADAAQLVSVFSGAAVNLASDGVLVFDVNLLGAYRTFFAETVIFEDGDTYLAWRGRTPSDAGAGVLAEGKLDAFIRDADDSWRRHDGGHHWQRHYSEPQVRAALQEAGLDCVGVYGHGLDGQPVAGADELRHTKALFIARHSAPGGERR